MKDWFWIEAKQTFAGLTAISCATNRLTCVRASTAVANLGIADVRSCPKDSPSAGFALAMRGLKPLTAML
jgi:hypothetical protein